MRQMRARAFALRDVFPDVLRGMPVAEELEDMAANPAPVERHMGPAEVVQPEWPADKWAARLPQILDGIAQGKTVDDALAWLGSKGKVTAEQEKELRDKATKLQQAASAPAGTPCAPAVDPDKLAADLQACADLDKVYELGGLLDAITDEAQRLRITEIFDARVAQLEQP
ncbi:hypothetical protein [Comamonas terrigena]|uniref:hypothetical protein n=1 Tax=Comamonas terrigena TaxID=32013 RepID=UPI0028B1C386|nr:hypothetical protein [Comamonas terrigena]